MLCSFIEDRSLTSCRSTFFPHRCFCRIDFRCICAWVHAPLPASASSCPGHLVSQLTPTLPACLSSHSRRSTAGRLRLGVGGVKLRGQELLRPQFWQTRTPHQLRPGS